MKIVTIGKYLWAMPNTLAGIVLSFPLLIAGGRVRRQGGVIEIHGRGLSWVLERFSIAAVTLGHVVIGRNDEVMQECRVHELVHVRQYERWGPLFIPAYLASCSLAWLRGGSPYRDNRFELEAYMTGCPAKEPNHEIPT
jgi:hypothetical protein